MAKTISTGFIVLSKSNKVLIGKGCNRENNCWTVFKGSVEEGESWIEAAIRELKEESGIDINASKELQMSISSNPVHSYTMRNKYVHLYLLKDDDSVLDGYEFKCDSKINGDGPPEILDYKWVDIEELNEYLFFSQQGIQEYLCQTIK